MQQPLEPSIQSVFTPPRLRVLLIEDDEYYARVVRKHLIKPESGFAVVWVDRLATAADLLEEETFDVILLDLWLPDASDLDGFYHLRTISRDTPLVVLTNNENAEIALEAVRNGAQDFLVKERISTDSIARAARYAVERVKAEQSQSRLEAINDFMAMLMHDLRVPLLATARALDLVLDQKTEEHHRERLLDGIRNGNEHLLDLVNKLVETYRYETGVSPFHTELCRLDDILAKSLQSFKRDDRNLKFFIEYDEDLGMVKGDAKVLERLFTNIIGNALQHGGEHVTLQITARARGGFWELIFADDGPGIPKEIQKRLFTRVWHGVAGKNYTTTGGLGLYLSQRIAERHGGTIEVGDNPIGTGTIITVRLPIADSTSG